jgi:hypothetical protein
MKSKLQQIKGQHTPQWDQKVICKNEITAVIIKH